MNSLGIEGDWVGSTRVEMKAKKKKEPKLFFLAMVCLATQTMPCAIIAVTAMRLGHGEWPCGKGRHAVERSNGAIA